MAPQCANKLNLIPKMMTFLFAPENGIIIITIEKLDSPHPPPHQESFLKRAAMASAMKRTLPRASHELLHTPYGFLHDLSKMHMVWPYPKQFSSNSINVHKRGLYRAKKRKERACCNSLYIIFIPFRKYLAYFFVFFVNFLIAVNKVYYIPFNYHMVSL